MWMIGSESFRLEAEAARNLGMVHDFIRKVEEDPISKLQRALEIDFDLRALLCQLQTYQSDRVLFETGFATFPPSPAYILSAYGYRLWCLEFSRALYFELT
ncbi:hypothetical protein BBP40_004232 [Aspergillus hancockii]|nr:hypothetical protein BBP40_004232 [Aspergillus hancockii]